MRTNSSKSDRETDKHHRNKNRTDDAAKSSHSSSSNNHKGPQRESNSIQESRSGSQNSSIDSGSVEVSRKSRKDRKFFSEKDVSQDDKDEEQDSRFNSDDDERDNRRKSRDRDAPDGEEALDETREDDDDEDLEADLSLYDLSDFAESKE